jgi:hypothetical protein
MKCERCLKDIKGKAFHYRWLSLSHKMRKGIFCLDCIHKENPVELVITDQMVEGWIE